MTKKRFIKLMMGRLGLSRNEAREKAKIFGDSAKTISRCNSHLKQYCGDVRVSLANYKFEFAICLIDRALTGGGQ